MKYKSISTRLFVTAALFLGLAGAAQAADLNCGLNSGEPATGTPIKVGAIVGETGPDDFSSAADAAGAYFDCVNANGGINGRPIEYLVEDDQWNPEVAAQVANKLVRDQGVVALVGSASFVEMGVNAALYKEEGVMSMASGCAVAECYESANIVSTNAGPLPSAVGAAQWAVANHGAKNIVCVTNNIPTSGIYSCSWVVKYMEAQGLEGSLIAIDTAAVDMNSAVLEVLVAGADTVMVNLPAGLAAALLKVMEEQDLRDQYKWISSTPLYDPDVPAVLGEYWDGVMYVNAELNAIDGTGPDTTNWRGVMDAYARPEDPRDTFSQSGYLSARYFVDAMLELDPAKIDRATVTETIRGIVGVTSDLTCGPYYVGDADRHMPNHANIMMKMVNGGFEQVTECTEVNSAYLEPYLAIERELGLRD